MYAAFVLLPFVFRIACIYLFERRGWTRRIAALLIAAVGFSLVHTSLMALSRHLLFPAFGLGPYDYGIMRYRYPMELSNYLMVFTSTGPVLLLRAISPSRRSNSWPRRSSRPSSPQAQLDNLRLQLQPHFLFNTLNTISSVMYEDVRAADAMLPQLSELLRLTLRASRPQEISLAEELQITRLYLDLMHKRFENKLDVSYAIDPARKLPRSAAHPAAAGRELAPPWVKPGRLEISLCVAARRDNGALVLQVSDNGVGLGPDGAACLGRGVGLANIRSVSRGSTARTSSSRSPAARAEAPR